MKNKLVLDIQQIALLSLHMLTVIMLQTLLIVDPSRDFTSNSQEESSYTKQSIKISLHKVQPKQSLLQLLKLVDIYFTFEPLWPKSDCLSIMLPFYSKTTKALYLWHKPVNQPNALNILIHDTMLYNPGLNEI